MQDILDPAVLWFIFHLSYACFPQPYLCAACWTVQVNLSRKGWEFDLQKRQLSCTSILAHVWQMWYTRTRLCLLTLLTACISLFPFSVLVTINLTLELPELQDFHSFNGSHSSESSRVEVCRPLHVILLKCACMFEWYMYGFQVNYLQDLFWCIVYFWEAVLFYVVYTGKRPYVESTVVHHIMFVDRTL